MAEPSAWTASTERQLVSQADPTQTTLECWSSEIPSPALEGGDSHIKVKVQRSCLASVIMTGVAIKIPGVKSQREIILLL